MASSRCRTCAELRTLRLDGRGGTARTRAVFRYPVRILAAIRRRAPRRTFLAMASGRSQKRTRYRQGIRSRGSGVLSATSPHRARSWATTRRSVSRSTAIGSSLERNLSQSRAASSPSGVRDCSAGDPRLDSSEDRAHTRAPLSPPVSPHAHQDKRNHENGDHDHVRLDAAIQPQPFGHLHGTVKHANHPPTGDSRHAPGRVMTSSEIASYHPRSTCMVESSGRAATQTAARVGLRRASRGVRGGGGEGVRNVGCRGVP